MRGADHKLLDQRLAEAKAAGVSKRSFAEDVLVRDLRTVRRWLAGGSIPQRVADWLRDPRPAPWPRGYHGEN